jgi:hypothetical protein
MAMDYSICACRRETEWFEAPARSTAYLITASLTAGNDVNVIDTDIQTPYTLAWSMGFQRSLGNNINLEWGVVLLVFGGVMLWLGRFRRAGPRSS